jgi:Uma2 family endonuclease
MSSVEVQTPLPQTCPIDWQPAPPPTNLIFDDGEPLETNRHRIAMNVLIEAAMNALADQAHCFIGGNMFVYYSSTQKMNQDFRGPDFFVALDVDGERERQGWVVWEENGQYPNVIVELMSPSTYKIDQGEKKRLYERTFRTANYYVYNPFEPDSLEGWFLDAAQNRYRALSPNEKGWLWCETLGLWLGNWSGQINREPAKGTCNWLRFYDPEGNLIPLDEEIAKQAQEKADQAQQRADQAEQLADQAQQRAHQAEQLAGQAQQRADWAEQLANEEQQRAERLAAYLRAQGVDPDQI